MESIPPPLPTTPRMRQLRPWVAVALAMSIILAILAGVFAVRLVVQPSRPSEWIMNSLTSNGFAGTLTPEVPVATFGSMSFRGPFVVEVAATPYPVELWLRVSGQLVLRGRVYEVAYAYPFETDQGNPLSMDLTLSLAAPSSTNISTSLSTPDRSPASSFRTANLSPSDWTGRLFPVGHLWSAFTPAEPSGPIVSLNVTSYTFPPDATWCYGAHGFEPRGVAWANMTVADDVRYYYEIWLLPLRAPYNVTSGHVEGSIVNRLQWIATTFDFNWGICKPSRAASIEVAVEGTM